MIKLWHFDVIAAGRVLSSWTTMMILVLPPDRKSGAHNFLKAGITSRELDGLQGEDQLFSVEGVFLAESQYA